MSPPTAGSAPARALGQLKRAATLRGAIYNPFDGALPRDWLTPMNATATKPKPLTPRNLRQLARECRERAARARVRAIECMSMARRWRDEHGDMESAAFDVQLARLNQRGAIRDRRMARHFIEDAKRMEQIRAVPR